MMSDRISINSEIWLAGANWLCGYKSRSWERWQSLIFIPPSHPPTFPPRVLNIRLDIKYLKINLLSSLEQAPGRRFGEGGLVWGGVTHWVVLCARGVRQLGTQSWLSLVGAACLSQHPELPCTIPQRGLPLVAPGQLVMSVLKTPEQFSKRLEPVSICPVSAVSPRAAGRLSSAGSWPQLWPAPWGWAGTATCPAQPRLWWRTGEFLVWSGRAGARVVSHAGALGACSAAWFAALDWTGGGMEGELGAGRGQDRASLGLWLLQGKRGAATDPQAWGWGVTNTSFLSVPLDLDTHVYKNKIKQRRNAQFPGLWLFRNDHSMFCCPHGAGSPSLWSHVRAEIVRLEDGNFWIWAALGSISQTHTLTAALPFPQHVLNQLDKWRSCSNGATEKHLQNL